MCYNADMTFNETLQRYPHLSQWRDQSAEEVSFTSDELNVELRDITVTPPIVKFDSGTTPNSYWFSKERFIVVGPDFREVFLL